MDDLEFEPHAREEMASDAIYEDEVYHVVGAADDEYERDDGRIRYERLMEDDRHLVVIVEDATQVSRQSGGTSERVGGAGGHDNEAEIFRVERFGDLAHGRRDWSN